MARMAAQNLTMKAAIAALAASAAACATAPEPVEVVELPDRIEPFTLPQPGEACLAVWEATPELQPVEARGGMVLGGGLMNASATPRFQERDTFGCMGSSDAMGEVYVEARYAGGNYWHADAWRVEITCSEMGAIGGSDANAHSRCATAALAPSIRIETASLRP